jgi:hypothetical protein
MSSCNTNHNSGFGSSHPPRVTSRYALPMSEAMTVELHNNAIPIQTIPVVSDEPQMQRALRVGLKGPRLRTWSRRHPARKR